MKRTGLIAIVFVVLAVWLINSKPYGDPKRGGFTEIFYTWSEEQEEISDKVTTAVVSDVEGKYVPEHKDDGSNWSIPNIIRKLLGVSDDE